MPIIGADGCKEGLVPRPTFSPPIACQEPALCGSEPLAACCTDGPACSGTDARFGSQLTCVEGVCDVCGQLGVIPCEGAPVNMHRDSNKDNIILASCQDHSMAHHFP